MTPLLAAVGADVATAFIEIGLLALVLASLARLAGHLSVTAVPFYLLAGLTGRLHRGGDPGPRGRRPPRGGMALGHLSVEVSSHRVADRPYGYDHIDVALHARCVAPCLWHSEGMSRLLDRAYAWIMSTMIERGQAPHHTELAAELGVSMERGRQLVHELLALTPGGAHPGTDYIASFPPFNNQPTQYCLSVDGRQRWFGQ
ncbi:MAG: hypothetical protein ACFCVK_18865 [Acidimicrobiales bacterium]